MWFFIVLIVFFVFITVLLVRAFKFAPNVTELPAVTEAIVNAETVTDHLSRMVQCKTVSYAPGLLSSGLVGTSGSCSPMQPDVQEFDKFRGLLTELYPTIHMVCPPELIGPSGLLYKINGKSADAPVVFMAHYDVVHAQEDAWEKPAFSGLVENGEIWGRGTLDTKVTICGVMEAAEELLSNKFLPENDIYLAFSGDEELGGPSAPAIVEELHKRGIAPAMVLDEGGAVVENVFPGVNKPCALIGIAEKGLLNVELSFTGGGGHASAPLPHTPVGILARAVTRIENRPFKPALTASVARMFNTLGRHASFIYRLIFANLWCFFPIMHWIYGKRGGEVNAMFRTTCAFTMMKGSESLNIIPPEAKMGANLRILTGDTHEGVVTYLKKIVNDPQVSFHVSYAMNPSKTSKTEGIHWERLQNVISQTWPDALISPYMMMACTDSRHYYAISDYVYRFSAIALSKEERASIHGNNERIKIKTAVKVVQFYLRLLRMC
jgi:carboxypeptidase PM20D1